MEIERKFLLNPDYDVYDIVTCYPHEIIADYYFNPTTRLRHINNLKNEKLDLEDDIFFSIKQRDILTNAIDRKKKQNKTK